MNNTTISDKDLNPVLEIADNEDLAPLVEYVTSKISEDLTDHDAYKKHSPNHRNYADLIAKEVRDMGGGIRLLMCGVAKVLHIMKWCVTLLKN